ncbi:hypothetical protein PHYSODRAFT_341792 [Phytophthora sojae]|uniref:Tim44-like domain-containing protein n=1 Tax=Phytophthora sojae (strain P6497) TaxID=1094619 RepID=G5AED5_PHYSP|nr:hypothetical protein PHYSODRAFT_341792 [Phytophthora sojae]EGZ06537.1 hypothetical protein PHYSODRAFT_341792 [Phytophthora sojae]|eukprot:XP_009538434.1 hypothetical protein PHYSODRAFT_341792 [Phytophthora sojae]
MPALLPALPALAATKGFKSRLDSRRDEYRRCLDRGVFETKEVSAETVELFGKAQLPADTEIDLVDFIEGAKGACERVMSAIYSQEMMDYVAERTSARPAIADEMEAVFMPMTFQRDFMDLVWAADRAVQSVGARISGSKLMQIDNTIDQTRDELAAPEFAKLQRHKRLKRMVKCVEDEGEQTVDEGESTFVLCFESLATRPDDVDWRIQKMEMIHPE